MNKIINNTLWFVKKGYESTVGKLSQWYVSESAEDAGGRNVNSRSMDHLSDKRLSTRMMAIHSTSHSKEVGPSLDGMPPELLRMILVHMNSEDMMNLRATSKELSNIVDLDVEDGPHAELNIVKNNFVHKYLLGESSVMDLPIDLPIFLYKKTPNGIDFIKNHLEIDLHNNAEARAATKAAAKMSFTQKIDNYIWGEDLNSTIAEVMNDAESRHIVVDRIITLVNRGELSEVYLAGLNLSIEDIMHIIMSVKQCKLTFGLQYSIKDAHKEMGQAGALTLAKKLSKQENQLKIAELHIYVEEKPSNNQEDMFTGLTQWPAEVSNVLGDRWVGQTVYPPSPQSTRGRSVVRFELHWSK